MAVMGAAAAVSVLYKKEIEQAADPVRTRNEKVEEFSERFNGPFEAVFKSFANAAVKPEQTRICLIRALEVLATKQEQRPNKKHGLMPV